MNAKIFRTRRLRRTAKQVQTFGKAAKRRHADKGGRSGSSMTKKLKGMQEHHNGGRRG